MPMTTGKVDWDVNDMKTRRKFGIAALFIAMSFVALSYLAETYNLQSPANLLWMVGIPVGTGLLIGRNAVERFIASIGLMILGLVASMVFAYLFWGGI